MLRPQGGAVGAACFRNRRYRRRNSTNGMLGHTRASESVVRESRQDDRDVGERQLVEGGPFSWKAAHGMDRWHTSNRSGKSGCCAALTIGREEEMPDVGLRLQQEMTEDPDLFTDAGRKRGSGRPPSLDQHGRVSFQMPHDVSDQVLAAVVPRWRDWFRHEENLSHRRLAYAGRALCARA